MTPAENASRSSERAPAACKSPRRSRPRAKTLFVYQRTPGWVLPKIDFEFSPLARRELRLPGFITAVNVLGRVLMDAFMVVPIVHMLPRLPDTALVRVLPLYDKWSRLLYRLLLRATVDNPAYRRALVPRIGILAKRPVISSSFFKALNNPNTALITTPIERITRTGVRTSRRRWIRRHRNAPRCGSTRA